MTQHDHNAEWHRRVAVVCDQARAHTQQHFEQETLLREEHCCLRCPEVLGLAAHHIEPLLEVCLRVARAGGYDLATGEGRAALLAAVLADPGTRAENGATLCPTHHAAAHAGTLTRATLRRLVAGRRVSKRPVNAKLRVREQRSAMELASVCPPDALKRAVAPSRLGKGDQVIFADFVGAPLGGVQGVIDRDALTDGQVMVRVRERLAVAGGRPRLHFRVDPRMIRIVSRGALA